MLEIQVRGYKDIEAFCLRYTKQFTISEGRPASFICRLHVMSRQRIAQRDGRTLVKKDAHSSRRQRALRGVVEHLPSLLRRDPWKPIHELGNIRSVFQVLEKGGDWHACTAKHPSSTYALWVSLYCRACRPINHGCECTPRFCSAPNVGVELQPA
jgi:hypothetical protein